MAKRGDIIETGDGRRFKLVTYYADQLPEDWWKVVEVDQRGNTISPLNFSTIKIGTQKEGVGGAV